MAPGAFAQPAATGTVLDSMDELSFHVAPEKADKVTMSQVAGHQGKAVQLSFADAAVSAFAQSHVHGTPEWDQAAGFSFWVKGDGSTHLGAIEVIWNEEYARRYAYAFRIDSTDWKKVMVPWSDLVPELSGPRPMIGTPEAPASKLSAISFGKWNFWSDYAAHSYAIDDIRLEPTIPAPPTNFQPTGDPLARVKAKIRAGQPITIVTMGDSLTDFRHWSNRETNWPTMLSQKLKDEHKVTMTLINPALGGTELRQNVVLIPRWVQQNAAPDLVTVLFGANDYASGMRGADFQIAQEDAVRRIRRATGGKSDVLLISPRPNLDNLDALGEMAEATRKAAHSQNAGLADVYKIYRDKSGDLTPLYGWDKVHLSKEGQEVVSNTVLQALGG